MATCPVNKIDSNQAGLSFAEEECPKELPLSPVWYEQEPNSYSDFGANITTVARNPINRSRQRKKGAVTDLDASGGYNTDLTQTNLERLMQGFVFADARQKPTLKPLNGTAQTVSAAVASTSEYTISGGGTAFAAGALVAVTGMGVAANNGLKSVDSSTATTIVVNEAVTNEASAPATANISQVGFEFGAGEVDLTMVGGLPTLSIVSGLTEFTDLGLILGEWVFVGGDLAVNRFANNVGFARISAISTTALTFDKTTWAGPVGEVGTGKSIRLFFGTIIRNEDNPALIKRRTYQLERTLGEDQDGVQSEYLIGAVPNEFTLNLPQTDKVTADLSFVAMEYETRTGQEGLKTGARPALVEADAFNTSSDLQSLRLSIVTPGNAAPTPLFAFATEMTVTINNGITPNKALGVIGAMDTSAGTFEVGGSITAYFATVDAAAAVRNNADVTMDLVLAKKNAGILIDIPLMTLGNGRLNVVQDQPIMIPLDQMAARSDLTYTLLMQFFDYLPSIAEA